MVRLVEALKGRGNEARAEGENIVESEPNLGTYVAAVSSATPAAIRAVYSVLQSHYIALSGLSCQVLANPGLRPGLSYGRPCGPKVDC